jgi:hypothetical protein
LMFGLYLDKLGHGEPPSPLVQVPLSLNGVLPPA